MGLMEFAFLYLALMGRDAACYPPAPEIPALAQIAPDRCLYYAMWSGRAAPDAESKNRTEQLLAEPEVKEFYGAIAAALGGLKPDKEDGKASLDLIALTFTRPTALFVEDFKFNQSKAKPASEKVDEKTDDLFPASPGTDPPAAEPQTVSLDDWALSGALVVYFGEDAPKAEALIRTAFPEQFGKATTTKEIEGVMYAQHQEKDGPAIYFAVHKGFLIVAAGEEAAKNVALGLADKRGPPKWLAQLRARSPTEQVASVSYLNVARIVEGALSLVGDDLKKEKRQFESLLDAIGVRNLASVASVSGLDGPGMLSRGVYEIQGEPRGLATAVPNRPLAPSDFADIPAEARRLFVGRIDLNGIGKAINQTGEVFDLVPDDDVLAQVVQVFRAAEAQLGISFAKDLFGPMGDRFALFDYAHNETVTIIPLRDSARFRTTLDTLRLATKKDGKEDVTQKIAGHDVVTTTGEKSCTCLLDDRFVIAATIETMRRYLERDAKAASAATKPDVAAILARNPPPVLLAYDDAHGSFGEAYLKTRQQMTRATGYLSLLGINFDAGTVPSRHVIEKHLSPSIWTVTRTDYGLVTESRGTLPIVQFNLLASIAELFQENKDEEKKDATPGPN